MIGKESWIPFANGPRQCPARNFALYEQRALAVMLLREYTWVLPEGSVHRDGLKNAFSPFALTVPENRMSLLLFFFNRVLTELGRIVDITFTKLKN